MNELLLCGWESLDEPGRKCRRPNGHYGAHALATSDSEEALSGVARDLDVTDEPSSPVLRARLAFDALVQQFGSRGAMEAIGAVRAALAATEAPAAEQHRVLGTCQDCGAQGYVGAAVAVPLDDIDALRLARALVFHRYGIRVKDANPADVDDAKAIAAAYRDAKP